jgi:hypothetical protein
MKRYIAFSLYGPNPLYAVGMAENIRIAPEVYPGWSVVIHASASAIPNLRRMAPAGYELIEHPESVGHQGMFWRFHTAVAPDAEYTIFRDADSRLNVRERAAVEEWIGSGRAAHVMRDHRDHAWWPMLGGMWGLRRGAIPDLLTIMAPWEKLIPKLADMQFQAAAIWPRIREDMVHHSSVPTPHPYARPFPAHPPYPGFVGEIVPPSPELLERYGLAPTQPPPPGAGSA